MTEERLLLAYRVRAMGALGSVRQPDGQALIISTREGSVGDMARKYLHGRHGLMRGCGSTGGLRRMRF